MVDPFQLTTDILANTLSLAVPALLWAVLYLVAWEHEAFADSIGFGRRAFWLLLPGALLATFGVVPLGPVSTDVVAVSFSGALFPLLVGLLAFGRAAPPRARSIRLYLTALLVEGALLFALVLPGTASLSQAFGNSLGWTAYVANDVLVALAAAVVTAVVVTVGFGSSDPVRRRVAFLLALTSGVLVVTFVQATALPGVGIAESFPFYLLPPVAAGAIATAFARRVFPGEEAFALPTAFLAGTFGVLLGADLLRQPPLYGTGPSGVYTIGGAGVFDLVYLSGLLAFGAAYLVHRGLRRGIAPVGPAMPARPRGPLARLTRAFRAGLDGRLGESLRESAASAREAAGQTRQLLGLPPAPEDRPWQDLPVPGWLVADQANLDAVARAGTTDGREGFRSWLTARWLVWIARDIGVRRFAPLGPRISAFGIDLAIVTLPAVGVWVAVLLAIPGGITDALLNVGFNAAIYGFVAWAFLYFVIAETFWGTTVGKSLLGLEVRERSLAAPSGLAAMVRNATVLPMLTVVGVGVAIALTFALKTGSTANLSFGGISLPSGAFIIGGALAFVGGGVLLLGAGAVAFITATAERQRLGDLWAGTWVVRRLPTSPPPVTTPSSAPPGPGRSG